MSDLKSVYNSIADAWHEMHKDIDWWIPGVDKLLSCVPRGGTILDVGCGTGVASRYMTEKGYGVTGIDFAEEMIRRARIEAPRAEFKVMDMRDAASLGPVFDGIVAQACLLHIPKKEAARVVSALAGALKPGGYLYIAVKERKEHGPEEEIRTDEFSGKTVKRFFSFYTKQEIENLFKSVGLDVIWSEARVSGRARWVMVIGKLAKNALKV